MTPIKRVMCMDNHHVHFRQLLLTDQPAYQALIQSAYQSINQNVVSFDAAYESTEDNIRWLKTVPTFGLFNEEGILVSSVSLRFPWGPEPGPKIYPHIGRLATHADYKGQGYARMTFEYIERYLRDELKCPIVTLGTADRLPWLVSMYERWGFQEFDRKHLGNKKHITVYLKKDLA